MRIVVFIAIFTLPICAFSQMFFQPSTEKQISDYTYHCLDGVSEDTGKYWEADSISKINLTSAFSVEAWQFVPTRQTDSLSILQIYSQDTLENYFKLNLDNNAYIEIAFVVGDSAYQVDTENEVGGAPLAYSGVIEVKDWYHLVFTWDGASDYNMYVNGLAAAAFDSDEEGAINRPDIYGDYLFRCWNHHRTGPIRFFQKELTSGEVATLWNSGQPLLSTSIDSLKIEYDHESDVWTGDSTWVVIDDADSPVNGQSVGFSESSWVPVKDYEPNQTRSYIIPPGRFFVIDEYLGHNYYNQENSLSREVGPIGSYNQGPVVWYDTAANQTIISVNDRVGLGGNLQGMVMVYDHDTDRLYRRAKNGNSAGGSTNGVVNSHQGQSVISTDGRVIVAQERNHDSPIYYNSGDFQEGVVNFSGLGNYSSGSAYPGMQVVDSALYVYFRHTSGSIRINSSADNGQTWDGISTIATLESGDWFYPYSCYHPSRLSILCRRRDQNNSGEYTQAFFIQSDDGANFYNADSSYSQSSNITDAQLDNYLVYETDSIGIGQAARGAFNGYGNDMFVFFQPNYTTGTNTIESKTLYYAADKDTFSTKTVATTFEGYPVHISGSEWVLIGKELADFPGDGPLKVYRTTDFFDSLSYDSTLSGQWEVGRFRVTANAIQAEEIVIVAQVTTLDDSNLPGVNDYFGIYVMPK